MNSGALPPEYDAYDQLATMVAIARSDGHCLLANSTLENAVAAALRDATADRRNGAVVLLSPACASFDMFRNYVHRSEVFADAVRELAAEVGQPC